MLKICGVQSSKGEFNGKAWEKVIYHCEGDREGTAGVHTEKYSLNRSASDEMLKKYAVSHPDDLIGMAVNKVYYNRYGKPDSLDLE